MDTLPNVSPDEAGKHLRTLDLLPTSPPKFNASDTANFHTGDTSNFVHEADTFASCFVPCMARADDVIDVVNAKGRAGLWLHVLCQNRNIREEEAAEQASPSRSCFCLYGANSRNRFMERQAMMKK